MKQSSNINVQSKSVFFITALKLTCFFFQSLSQFTQTNQTSIKIWHKPTFELVNKTYFTIKVPLE